MSAMQSATIQNATILCVDPDPQAQQRVKAVLSGHETVFAANGYDAIRNLNSRPFDLYLLEYWLPDWNGVPFCRQIRRQDPWVPVIFHTERTSNENRARALRAGASAYIEKSADTLALRVQMTELLARRNTDSLKAKVEAERAVHAEFQRQAGLLAERLDSVRKTASAAMERSARAKALLRFVEAGGTRANFERWWPGVFDSARAVFKPATDAPRVIAG